MSQNDFDVVTGPSMPQRPVPPRQRASRHAETSAEPAEAPSTADASRDSEVKRR